MGNVVNLFTDFAHQVSELVAAGQSLVDSMSAAVAAMTQLVDSLTVAVAAMTQLADLLSQVMNLLGSLSAQTGL